MSKGMYGSRQGVCHTHTTGIAISVSCLLRRRHGVSLGFLEKEQKHVRVGSSMRVYSSWLESSTDKEEDDDDDVLAEDDGSSWEYRIQSVVAVFLLGALGLSAANVLLKVGVIAFALVSVAVRYTIIGILLVVLLYWFL